MKIFGPNYKYDSGKIQKIYCLNEVLDIGIVYEFCEAFHQSLKTIAINIKTSDKEKLGNLANYILSMPNLKSCNGISLKKSYIKINLFVGDLAETLLNIKLKDTKFNVHSVKLKKNFGSKYIRFVDFFYEERFSVYKPNVNKIIQSISNTRLLSIRDLLLINFNEYISTSTGKIDLDFECVEFPDFLLTYTFSFAGPICVQNCIFPRLYQIKINPLLNKIRLKNVFFDSESFRYLVQELQKLRRLEVIAITSNSEVKSNDLAMLVYYLSIFNNLSKVNLQIKTEKNIENAENIKSCLSKLLKNNLSSLRL
ncbi:hypothetical protein SteCoe_12927 [Stentor coeruleus]|uniref:Uncharacterized protein n=1 Tax=Stentor coeruleus TaxID=5963 RepID=A0A1R2C9L6_9CILI|nr:hypothetical protein SteCoe_12927 [Stentor coeruleus]